MPRELHTLPGGEVQENLAAGFFQFFFDELDFFVEADAERMFFRVLAEFVQLGLQFDDGLLEIKLMFHAFGILTVFRPESMRISAGHSVKKRKAGLASGLAW